ncbi:AMP-binding protein [Brevundimonas sp. VNH65]|uniref:AMP-binding protein n=1 Tax=Brevundimonas sp. VNH65 TaxID=3400917 RepID=UPI003BFACE02
MTQAEMDWRAAPCRPVRFGDVGLVVTDRPDGSRVLSARAALQPYERNLLKTFWRWADRDPDRTWIARREPDGAGGRGDWARLSYGEGRSRASSIAAWLIRRGARPERPVLILSENSPAHACWLFGAMAAGVPVCSVSVNYSTLGAGDDFSRLRHVVDLIRPGVIVAEHGHVFAEAIRAVAPADAVIVAGDAAAVGPHAVEFSEVLDRPDVAGIGARIDELDPTAPARYLLTSGSTGLPKAVIHTQAMMTGNTASGFQAMGDAFAWDGEVLDWLPWSHIAGSSLLTNISHLGGSLYIDDGRPTAEAFGETLRNLRELPLRFYGTMPLGYSLLADALEMDEALRRVFFRELRAMLFGGAGLPQALHDRFQKLAVQTTGQRFVFVSGYGSTETGSAISYTWWESDKVGIGLPVPGAELKLVPAGQAYEVRVKAASVTPGYFNDPARDAEAFDEEGWLRMGDLADFHDRDDPLQGLYFAGRTGEQFKLGNGAFVSGGRVRGLILAACPGLIRDLVVCGDGREQLGLLVWADAAAWTRLGPDGVSRAVREGLVRHNADHPGQTERVGRLMFLEEPPSVAGQELSDKGSINRSAVVRRRADAVDRLFARSAGPEVIVV